MILVGPFLLRLVCDSYSFTLVWFAVEKDVFPTDSVFLVHIQPFQFSFMLLVFVSECPNAVYFLCFICISLSLVAFCVQAYSLLCSWFFVWWFGFYCFVGFFFFFLPSPDVYKHVSQDLLGYLEVESGRVARGRKIGICQLSLMGKKSHHFADPFLWIAIAAWFPSSVTFR